MKLQIDPLFTIFKRHLDNAIISDNVSENDIVESTLSDYMKLINSRGFVPKRLEQFIQKDTKEEIEQMLRKTTYGHFGFSSFQSTRLTAMEKMKLRGC